MGETFGDHPQSGSAWVVGSVYPVTKAHDQFALLKFFARPRFGMVNRADFVKLSQNLGRRTSVERSLECANRTTDG